MPRPAGQVLGSAPSSPVRWVRRSRLVNPLGCSRKVSRVDSRAWAGVAEAHRGGVLPLDVDGVGDGGERVGSGDRVVTDALDAEQAPVGGEADLPQGG